MTSARPGSGPSAAGLPTTSAVVFDLGGVLIDWDPHYVLDDEAIVALDIAGAQRALDRGTPVAEVHARRRGAYPSMPRCDTGCWSTASV